MQLKSKGIQTGYPLAITVVAITVGPIPLSLYFVDKPMQYFNRNSVKYFSFDLWIEANIGIGKLVFHFEHFRMQLGILGLLSYLGKLGNVFNQLFILDSRVQSEFMDDFPTHLLSLFFLPAQLLIKVIHVVSLV